jgi:hypothetical protein
MAWLMTYTFGAPKMSRWSNVRPLSRRVPTVSK